MSHFHRWILFATSFLHLHPCRERMKIGKRHYRMRKRNWNTSDYGASYPSIRDLIADNYPRHTNIALLQAYGSNAWRVHNYLLEATATRVEKTLENLKQLTEEVNRNRKNDQVSCFNCIRSGTLIITVSLDTDGQSTEFAGETVDGAHF
jgi:hypothetical protein